MNDFPRISEGILGEQDIPKTNTELFLSLVGQYFPEAIKDGEVDFSALKEEMGEFAEIGAEHYDFTWAGKQAAKKEAQADLFGRTLRYKPEDSLNPDTTENIYIEGDNLEALKLLRRNYHGRIKMIYIDPPYNTGSDLVYHDDFTMSDEELAELSGNVVDGIRYQKNIKDNAKYHTNWLNLMYPRLKIARELLTEDGVIFISIDENEVDNLKKICSQIFGEKNFAGEFIWKNSSKNDQDYISIQHEYILVYVKSKSDNSGDWKEPKEGTDEIFKAFEGFKAKHGTDWKAIHKEALQWYKQFSEANPIYASKHYSWMDERGVYFPDNIAGPNAGQYVYDVIHPITGKVCKAPSTGWRFPESTMLEKIRDGYIHFGDDESTVPNKKTYLKDTLFQSIGSIKYRDGRVASKQLTALMGDNVFNNPKDVDILASLMLAIGLDDNDIVLDFFAGSASTAQAVNQYNITNNKSVKFIMIQLQENLYETLEVTTGSSKAVVKSAIKMLESMRKPVVLTELSKERIRRASQKLHIDYPDAVFDDGFKVFEVGKTTIRWNLMSDDELSEIDKQSSDTELLDFTDGHNDTDIVYEIMLRQYGIPLSMPIEKLDSISDRTYIFADAVVVCLEPKITDELIEKLADIEPTPAKFVLRDSAFGDNIEFKDFSFRKLSALISSHQTEEERKSKYNNYTVEFI